MADRGAGDDTARTGTGTRPSRRGRGSQRHALLGFNLGIEAMQLIVVVLVLPPLILLTRTRWYPVIRTVAATLTAVAAMGWLGARLGIPNSVADVADQIGTVAVPALLALWVVAGPLFMADRDQPWPWHSNGRASAARSQPVRP